MHCESQVVISKFTSKNFKEKIRHLRLRHKFIINLIFHGVISLDFIRSKNNIVNLFNMPLNMMCVLLNLTSGLTY